MCVGAGGGGQVSEIRDDYLSFFKKYVDADLYAAASGLGGQDPHQRASEVEPGFLVTHNKLPDVNFQALKDSVLETYQGDVKAREMVDRIERQFARATAACGESGSEVSAQKGYTAMKQVGTVHREITELRASVASECDEGMNSGVAVALLGLPDQQVTKCFADEVGCVARFKDAYAAAQNKLATALAALAQVPPLVGDTGEHGLKSQLERSRTRAKREVKTLRKEVKEAGESGAFALDGVDLAFNHLLGIPLERDDGEGPCGSLQCAQVLNRLCTVSPTAPSAVAALLEDVARVHAGVLEERYASAMLEALQ